MAIFIIDEADAHGLSLQYIVTSFSIRTSKPAKLYTTTLGGLANVLETINKYEKNSRLIYIADLPITVNVDKTISMIEELAKRATIVFIDHHTDDNSMKSVEQLKEIDGVKTLTFNSAYDMNMRFVEEMEKLFGISANDKEIDVAIAGAVADLDCKALKNASEFQKKLAFALDYLNYAYGRAALTKLAIGDVHYLINEAKEKSPVFKSYETVKQKANLYELSKKTVAILPTNFNAPMKNKAIAMFIMNNNVDYVIVPFHGKDFRSGKYTVAVAMYTNPCGNVRELVKRALPNAKVVGHPSFAIAILKESDEPIDQQIATKLIDEAIDSIVSELIG